jgi:hypothetical protein
VARQLSKENDVDVKVISGGLLELSVYIDDQYAIKTNPLWYPLPGKVAQKARELLTATQPNLKTGIRI